MEEMQHPRGSVCLLYTIEQEDKFLHIDEPTGKMQIKRSQGYYIQLNKEAGLTNLGKGSFCGST